MTRTAYTSIYCSKCGRIMGKKPGIQVVNGAICDDPICNFQPEVKVTMARDALIVAGALAGISIAQIAFTTDMTRQRVYQILDSWKAGV